MRSPQASAGHAVRTPKDLAADSKPADADRAGARILRLAQVLARRAAAADHATDRRRG